MLGFIWWLLIGLVAGWLAGHIIRGQGFGILGNVIVGVVGAAVGGFLFELLGLYSRGTIGSLVTATVGAVVLILLANWIRGR